MCRIWLTNTRILYDFGCNMGHDIKTEGEFGRGRVEKEGGSEERMWSKQGLALKYVFMKSSTVYSKYEPMENWNILKIQDSLELG